MDLLGLKESIQSDDLIIDLEIKNFSSENAAPEKKTFIPKVLKGFYAFSGIVFPNGSCPKYADYVSLEVKSSRTDSTDFDEMDSTNSMTCTASVVNVSGEAKYSQSFGMETILCIDSYVPGLERFIKRSTLLSQKEEFLPGDVLTVRFEFSFSSNQELDMLNKISEFFPSLFVDHSSLDASEIDQISAFDFPDLIIGFEEEDYCGFAGNEPSKLESAQATNDGIHEVIDADQTFDFGFRKKKEEVKKVVENKHQVLDDVIHEENAPPRTSGIGIQKINTEKTKNGAKPTPGSVKHEENKECQTSRYETKKLIEKHGDEIFKESNESSMVGIFCNEIKSSEKSENIKEKVRQFEETEDYNTRNTFIVTNGHRMFLKTNQSHKNRVDFSSRTDEELYKIFYSNVSPVDVECESIHRMHADVPYFSNLMDRDENALFHAEKNEEINLQEDAEGQRTTLTFPVTLNGSNQIVKCKELENFQHSSYKNDSLSPGKLSSDSAEKDNCTKNFAEGNQLKNIFEKTEKVIRNDESSYEEENTNAHKWDFFIHTADNSTIPIPFEEHKDTIGSKLLAASTVFENMLRHPMKERSERRVELHDTTSRTMNNLLSYVDNGKFSDIPLPDAYDLYEAADKYAVKNLMKACADFMSYFPIKENVWNMVKLAELHSDDYLLELAERVQKLIFRLDQTATKKRNELINLLKELSKDSFQENPAQSDFFAQDYNFYK